VQRKAGESSATARKRSTSNQTLPPELDFFKYDKGAPVTSAGDKGKSKKRSERDSSASGSDDEEDRSEDSDNSELGHAYKKRKVADETVDSRVPAAHRVATKGRDVPAPLESFASLKDRYDVPSRILSNLDECGYKVPTGVQEYGVPILLEVRYTNISRRELPYAELLACIHRDATLQPSRQQEQARRSPTRYLSSRRSRLHLRNRKRSKAMVFVPSS